ncbi:zinc ribbon domain-containing protein [Halobacillus kuroshimensis]|uniref:zinc ribbon domain-containing protein n=1 Tax=Halobacillus kuroshimensis TaxID=302481 RepID=UPI0004139867|nr:zinc ribbon domain-containing protein [Halobacillus kuroshimensis]
MKCPQCNHEQISGKFCGACGAPLDQSTPVGNAEQAATASTMGNQSAGSGKESVEKVKKMSGDYGQGALRFLKQPSLAFHTGESAFAQGLVTLIIYMAAFSMSLYFLANSLFKLMGMGFGEQASLPFFNISSRLFLVSLIGLVICLASLFMMARFMGLSLTIKQLIAQYGSLVTPFAAINVLAIVFGLSGAVVMTMSLLGVSTTFVLTVVPAIYIYHKGLLLNADRNVFYWSTGTSLLILFISYLIWDWIISDMLDKVDSFLSFF